LIIYFTCVFHVLVVQGELVDVEAVVRAVVVRAVAVHVAGELFAVMRVVAVQLVAPAGSFAVAADHAGLGRVVVAPAAGRVGHAYVVVAGQRYYVLLGCSAFLPVAFWLVDQHYSFPA